MLHPSKHSTYKKCKGSEHQSYKFVTIYIRPTGNVTEALKTVATPAVVPGPSEASPQTGARQVHPGESCNLDEVKKFSQTFQQRRTELGYTQWDVARALGYKTEQPILSFEGGYSSYEYMCKLRLRLEKWLQDTERMHSRVQEDFETLSESLMQRRENSDCTQRDVELRLAKWIKDREASVSDPAGLTNTSTAPKTSGKTTRTRTRIEPPVREALEKVFSLINAPNSEEFVIISNAVHLEKKNLKHWFKNR